MTVSHASSSLSLLVLQLHREFLRAGADVMQTFTFYSSEDKLKISGNVTNITVSMLSVKGTSDILSS